MEKAKRLFVQKREAFRVEASSLLREFNENLSLSLQSLQLYTVYDLFGFSESLLEKCRYSVFGEKATDVVSEAFPGGERYLAVEYLPGVIAALTTLPVIGVPVKSKALMGMDSLLSIVQMPSGIPVATMAIDGSRNAALYAVSILALQDKSLSQKLQQFRKDQSDKVLNTTI